MRRPFFMAFMAATLLAWPAIDASGVDFESFEFEDPNFTELHNADNTANPGNNWSTDINVLTDSFVQNGDYRIAKFNDEFVSSYLQIDDIDETTSGSRYIVADMSGWDIRGFDASNGEEIRFGFLNDNSGTSGSTVTAQIQISRNTSTEAMEIEANALGNGSTNAPTIQTVNTVQTEPFTMVLELDGKSQSYEAFYKDGSNPAQSLGIGAVAPGRAGNSIRFVINNNFGSDLDEFFAIDRIALTDTNPLEDDLLTLEVHRTTGVTRLINTTGEVLTGLESYSITSAVGALDSGGWKPITDNYDNMAGPGDGSVDADDDWGISSSSTIALSEMALGGDGGVLGIGQEVLLNVGLNNGPWIQNPVEDLAMELMFDGVVRRANVNFIGNNGERFAVGDLNFDGNVTVNDWTIFINGAETNLTGQSIAQAYQSGDLDGDGVNSIKDFGIFEAAFDAANGSGAFVAMLSGVPEPTTLVLMILGWLGLMQFAPARQAPRR